MEAFALDLVAGSHQLGLSPIFTFEPEVFPFMNPSRFFLPFLLVTFGTLYSAEMPQKISRPNIIFMISDDQRWDALGVVQREQGDRARFPWFKTPGLDRLAGEGVRFRNAMVTSSLCSPSRACFLTGRYNHLNGVADNRVPFPVASTTWATMLQGLGYETGYIGKWHMGNQRERPGFSWWASYIEHGSYNDCVFEINGKPTKTTGWVDDVSTDYAVEYLKRSHGRPFAIQIGYKSPHDHRIPPARSAELYGTEVANPVPNLGTPAIYLPEVKPNPELARSPSAMSKDHRNYFRCVSALDENVGRLLKVLDDLNLAENTVVIYASDNGYYLGEHMLGDKRTMYEESIRIPLLARFPGRFKAGTVDDSLVLNIDLMPTICELVGMPIPSNVQGRSWLPQAEGREYMAREGFLYEYFAERLNAQEVPPIVGLRTQQDKLITYYRHPEWDECFDLAQDPYEIRNLVRDPGSDGRVRELRGMLADEMSRTEYVIPAYANKTQWSDPEAK